MDRIGPYLRLIDADGCRALVRVSAIQFVADADPCRDTALVAAAGRAITVPVPLDAVLAALAPEP